MSKKGKGKKVKPSANAVDYDSYADKGWFAASAKFSGYERCHEAHPVLALGGGTVLGASCLHPRAGYDVYVGLDYGMQRSFTSFPWEPPVKSEVVEVYFPVTDGGVPKDAAQFRKMVLWLVEQLAAGRKVHIGCIGGHGRTGMLLAAIVSAVHGGSGAGEWVRQHYCKSAIETTAQVKFLHEHYGIAPVAPAKAWGASSASSKGAFWVGDGVPEGTSVLQPLSGFSLWDSHWVES